MKWNQISHIGLLRLVNEDSLCICEDLKLFAVADGMGGHQAGEVASQMAVKSLEHNLRSQLKLFNVDPAQALLGAVKNVNQEIYQASCEVKNYQGMGTTLTACLIDNDYLLTVHVGDSRAYLVNKTSTKQLTQDHTLVEQLVRRGRISREESRFHPKRNILTKAIGTTPEIEVDFDKIAISPGGKILLCTDGLTNHFSLEEINHIVLSTDDLQALAGILLEIALKRGGFDNITIIIVLT